MRRPMPFVRCSVPSCNDQRYCKGKCSRHYQQLRRDGRIHAEASVEETMRSACCHAPVREGRHHDYGKQYCTVCTEPCLWSLIPA